jgi:hypothetical protein
MAMFISHHCWGAAYSDVVGADADADADDDYEDDYIYI